MATIGFKGFGWILSIATVAPACYMVSSMVAAERARVEAVERAIIQAKRDIRALDTEFDTRSNFAQLERWNGDVLALAAPRADQFVASDTQLAQRRAPGEGTQYASLVVPSAPATIEAPAPQAAVAAVEARPVAPVVIAVAAKATVGVERAVANGRVQAVAMLDKRLLSDATLGELMSSARREGAKLR